MADVRMTKNRWRQLPVEVRQGTDDVTETYAGLIEHSAAVAAPYRYGVLQESVAVADARAGGSIARRRIVVGAYYGLFQHEGTTNDDGSQRIAPNPFLKDAVDYWRADYLQAIGLVVRGAW